MKTITSLLLFSVCQLSFGQTDTNIMAIGDWSAPVTNDFWRLRGRLLVFDAEKGKEDTRPHLRVYFELQNSVPARGRPLEFYFDRGNLCLHLLDGHDKPIALETGFYVRPPSESFTITLPPESTIRMPVGFASQSSTKPNGLVLSNGAGRYWTIRPDSKNDYYLSATFSRPTNHPSSLNYIVWQGTLQLPKVKIPTENIRK